MELRFARMLPEQVQTVSELADFIYPDSLAESVDVFRSRQRLFPQGSIVMEDSENLMHIWGYCFFHPWHDGHYVPLNTVIDEMPRTRTAYIHDLAVHPSLRGQGYGAELACNALDRIQSQGFKRCMLVAVMDTAGFWERAGFKRIGDLDYGNNKATYMALVIRS